MTFATDDTIPSASTDRAAQRLEFARAALNDPALTLDPASEDASLRSYWRAHFAHGSAVLMDAPPPENEKLSAWLDIDARLRAAGLHAPQLLAEDRATGFVLMEDLGTRLFLPELNESTVDDLYAQALEALLVMQTRVDAAGLPPYDEQRLMTELELMPAWFLQKHLGIAIECDEWDVIELAFRRLIDNALAQPRAFLFRDFHSRNLLVVDENALGPVTSGLSSPGLVDFQDALHGPLTYDLVSLLRDCYIEWDEARVYDWAESHRQRLRDAGALDATIDARTWRRWFDLMGLQRHVKVLGIFCRLWYRDGKRGYLNDLPRVWRYVRGVASQYSEFADFVGLVESKIGGRDLMQPSI